jgi:dihydrofolate reductase
VTGHNAAPAADLGFADSSVADFGLVLVAAVAENGVIGRDGKLPWRLPSDLRHFRDVTLGHPVMMGRKTYQAIGKPLRDRTNIVITRDPGFAAHGVVVAARLDRALEVARGDALRRGVAQIMVIGGADLYRQTIGCAARLEITVVHARPQGDSLFPPIDPADWFEIERTEHAAGVGDDAAFATLIYGRQSR